MKTVFGQLADELGHASAGGRHWSSPASAYLREQNDEIIVDRDHDGRAVGRIVYLARHHGRLLAVAEVDDSVSETTRVRVGGQVVAVDTSLYYSARRIGGVDDGLAIDSVALTAHPASIVARPVTFLPGALDHRQAADRWRSRLDRVEYELLQRAAVFHRERMRSKGPLTIADLGAPDAIQLGRGSGLWIDRRSGEPLGRTRSYAVDDYEPQRPPGKLRMRPCRIIAVR